MPGPEDIPPRGLISQLWGARTALQFRTVRWGPEQFTLVCPAPGHIVRVPRTLSSDGLVAVREGCRGLEVLQNEGVVMRGVSDKLEFLGVGTSPLLMDVHQASSLPASCSEMLLAALGGIADVC